MADFNKRRASDCVPEWTVTTLYDHFTILLEHQKESSMLARNMADKALQKAELASEKRFESVNEFRSSLNDYVKTLVTKTEFDIHTKNHNNRIEKIEKEIFLAMGQRQGLGAGWAILIGLFGIVGIIFGLMKSLQ